MPYLGDYAEDYPEVTILFTTRDSTGAPSTWATTGVEVYPAGSTTQITGGISVGADHDSVTGLNLVQVDLSADALYVPGQDYNIVISSGTVDGVSIVGEVIGTFSILNRASRPIAAAQAQGGTATYITLAASNPYLDDQLIGSGVYIHTGTGAGQFRVIIDFAAATDRATVTPNWTTAPDSTSEYTIIGGSANVTAVSGVAEDIATATSLATAQTDLDTITGAAGVLIDSTATSAQLVDDVWDEVLTGATHNISNSSGRRLRNIQDFGIYDMASVWVDEVGGTSTGTTDGEDATVGNRSDDFDNAVTVAASVGLDRIHVQNGNSITLTGTLSGYNVWGGYYSLALGGQSIADSSFSHATISGTGTGSTPNFNDCVFGTVTLPPCRAVASSLTGTLTVGLAGNYQFVDCQSGVAGPSAPVVDLGIAIGGTTMEFRRWSGGLTLNNVAAGDTVSVDVVSGGTITVNGTGGTVVVRGHCNVVDGSSGSIAITETSVVNMTKINSEVDTALVDADVATATALAVVDANTTGLGTTRDALGALTDAAAAGDPTTADTVMSYIKQIINTLEGTAGIPTFPAEAAPGNNVSLAEILRAIHTDANTTEAWPTTQMTESYTALTTDEPTPEQMLYMIWSAISDFGVVGTTLTSRKIDGATAAMTFTLDDATNPTDRTRAT